jgi:uncharacterized membrane protein YfcA
MLSIYLVVGALAGVMAGLFGIGGGVIVIPALTAIFVHLAFPDKYIMQMAVGTSLAIMITTSMSALYAHHKKKSVRWGMFRLMLPGLLIGAIIGVIVTNVVPSYFLQALFALFLFTMGIQLGFNHESKQNERVIDVFSVRIVSVCIGALSSLLGVGGGTLLVPFLLRCKMEMPEASGTSVACGLSIGIMATASFMTVGLFTPLPIPWSTGFIYWPAFLGIAFASTLFAPVGAMLAHTLPTRFLKRIFGLFLLLMSCDMLWSLK